MTCWLRFWLEDGQREGSKELGQLMFKWCCWEKKQLGPHEATLAAQWGQQPAGHQQGGGVRDAQQP